MAATTPQAISPGQNVILSMLHGIWQNRCLSLIVDFKIPDLLCDKQPLSIEEIATKTSCKSSKQLYPIMRVLAQWGIGKELPKKYFTSNEAMDLLRLDKGPSLGHLVSNYASEEHLMAMRSLPKCVREGTPAFELEHGMTLYEYMNDITNKHYDASKKSSGASKDPVGSDERREERAKTNVSAMVSLSNLAILPNQEVNNIYKAFPWSTCSKLVDMGAGAGHFLASVLKQPNCEHIEGYIVDLPYVIDQAQEQFSSFGVLEHRINFIKQDFTKPFPDELLLEVDTVMFMNIIGYFLKDIEKVTTILKNARSLFSKNGGKLLIIENCCPDPGDLNNNVGINGRQLGYHSIHFLTVAGVGFYSKSELIGVLDDIGSKSGYKLAQVYDTFAGGFNIFELTCVMH